MVQTIVTSSHISVQGEFVKRLSDGRIVVRVGDAKFVGHPVARAVEAIRKLGIVKTPTPA
ncbi:hypothetical protein [Oceanibium sediminis]|uniref:hypothetical protein n=1 Tax=Oceanibium sediminis TaxID=2026339 RepID=UPI000DD3FCA9|nr:hypothetical protein [Oceanibium sediminis]